MYWRCPRVLGRTTRPRPTGIPSVRTPGWRWDFLAHHLDDTLHPVLVETFALLEQDEQLFEDGSHLVYVLAGAGEGELVATRHHPDTGEEGFDGPQVSIALAEQLEHEMVARNAPVLLSFGGRGKQRSLVKGSPFGPREYTGAHPHHSTTSRS